MGHPEILQKSSVLTLESIGPRCFPPPWTIVFHACVAGSEDEAEGATPGSGLLDRHMWGATPCIKIVRTMGLGLSTLDGAVLIPKPIVRMIPRYEAVCGAVRRFTGC